jgi:hypothetical protein
LLRDDMLDMMGERTMYLTEHAVLTAIASPATNQLAKLGGGHGYEFEFSLRWALSFTIAMKSAPFISAS